MNERHTGRDREVEKPHSQQDLDAMIHLQPQASLDHGHMHALHAQGGL